LSCTHCLNCVSQVGILAFELLTGAPPFEAEDINVTAALILWGRVEHYPLYVTENAIDFIKQCLQTNPKKRPDIHALIRHPWLQKTVRAPNNYERVKYEACQNSRYP
jgi:serine/threonine protein kinase